MSYVDAIFDRDADIIRAVERRDGKRKFTEYPIKYTFYYEDPRGKYKSVYGDSLTRVVFPVPFGPMIITNIPCSCALSKISNELFQSRYCCSSIKVFLLDFLLYFSLACK